ncbi:hypothetical protein [Herminiimonas sp. KBW02]|uniref:hypothetical protein n=1 Tax=Herminiimonas sp. KBW02 TaxID=2153363 RepID=UPI000F5901E8|nr:hypothetical protein [Herminiimonas sp. KBW02]
MKQRDEDAMANDFAGGMTDEQLEKACKVDATGIATWRNWTTEVYSFGKCFRYLSKYPRIFPLYCQADHGVGLESLLQVHELNESERIHFTWNPVKAERFKDSTHPQVVRIPHPWIGYRKGLNIKRKDQPSGTIVFFTHLAPGLVWEGHDSDEYFSSLRNLPEKFQPVVLCLHMHDINAGHHKELRRHGFPLVTAGNSSSTMFVDRFYNLIKNYSYATSQDWGSQVAYCVELGVPYFFMGSIPKLINLSHPGQVIGEVPRYQDEKHEHLVLQAERLFRSPVDQVTLEQATFVRSMLGLDSKLNQADISKILWGEFYAHWRNWPQMLKPIASHLLRKMGLLEMVRKVLKKS